MDIKTKAFKNIFGMIGMWVWRGRGGFALRGSCKNVECNLVSYSVKTDTWGCMPAPGPSHLAVWMYIFVQGGISEIYLWGTLKNRGAIFKKKNMEREHFGVKKK